MKHVPRVKQETSVWHAKMEGKGLQCLPEGREGQLAQGFFIQSTMSMQESQMFSNVPLIVQGIRNAFVKHVHWLGSLPSIYQGNQTFGGPFPLPTKVTRN